MYRACHFLFYSCNILKFRFLSNFYLIFFSVFSSPHTRNDQKNKRRLKRQEFEGKQLIISVIIVLKRHYPNFDDLLNSIPDHRKRSTYQVGEIIMAGLSMFIFKRNSRNHTDQVVNDNFQDNYINLFGKRLPIMETVNDFLRRLPPEELEKLKHILVQRLVERKVLEKWKYMGCYVVSVDGTGVVSFENQPYEGCPYKVSKNGKTSWQAHVVEAKIVCGNGFNISIASEWLNNAEDLADKQDCELKAFERLADKIKTLYPRLPVIITGDALYPNRASFDICKQYNWHYIFVLKEGSLKSVWREINLLYPLQEKANARERTIGKRKEEWLNEKSMFINGLEYYDHRLNWVEYQQYYAGKSSHMYFAHITDITVERANAWQISKYGRMRWIIENQGFNTQKNGGYALQHKYSRKFLWAMKNYYELLQIAHLIDQLTVKLIKVRDAMEQAGYTVKSVVEDMVATMKKERIGEDEIQLMLRQTKQLRY